MSTLQTPTVTPSIPPEVAPTEAPAPAAPTPPTRRRWSRDEYYKLADLGLFAGQKVELVDGEIVQMAPQSNTHAVMIEIVARALRRVFSEGDYWIRQQFTVDLGDTSISDPDIAVVQGSLTSWAERATNPTTALLVVEIAVTSGAYDKGAKASLYARAGIADYWVVDVPAKQLQVRRRPAPDAGQPFGHGYLELMTLDPSGVVAPVALPDVSLAVADLLPR